MRGRALVAALAAGFVAFAALPPLAAEDAPSPAVVAYEEGCRALGERAAAALWKAAEAARKLELHAFAAEAAERALTYDPDHKKARKHLGFVRKKSGWERDPREAAKVQRVNVQPDRMTPAAFAARERAWRDDDLGAALSTIAGLFADLGARCEGQGYAVEARRAREEALRLDPDCAAARTALGYVLVGTTWMTAAQKAAREAASKPVAFEEASHLDAALGTTLTKARSANVVAESVFGADRVASLVSALETTYTYYLTDAGRDPNAKVFPSPVKACFLANESEWWLWLQDQVRTRADFFRPLNFYRSSATMLLGVRESADAGPGVMEDNAVHAMTHLLNDVVWKLRSHPWLDEGLAYYYTLKVRGTTESSCVEPDDSRYASEGGTGVDAKITESAWRHRVKQLVAAGDDMDLRMLTARPLNELKLSETMKGWSVASWLMETDRDAALRVFGALGAAPSGAAALEEQLGRSVEETDAAWRAWVLRTH